MLVLIYAVGKVCLSVANGTDNLWNEFVGILPDVLVWLTVLRNAGITFFGGMCIVTFGIAVTTDDWEDRWFAMRVSLASFLGGWGVFFSWYFYNRGCLVLVDAVKSMHSFAELWNVNSEKVVVAIGLVLIGHFIVKGVGEIPKTFRINKGHD